MKNKENLVLVYDTFHIIQLIHCPVLKKIDLEVVFFNKVAT